MLTLVTTTTILSIAAVIDIRFKLIPNWITYTAMIAGLALGIASYFGIGEIETGLIQSLSGLGVCSVIMGSIWFIRGTGGGDTKLVMGIGALTGTSTALTAIVFTYLIAGGIVMAWMILRTSFVAQFSERMLGYLPRSLSVVYRRTPEFKRGDMATHVPMAGFFMAGTLCTFYLGPMF